MGSARGAEATLQKNDASKVKAGARESEETRKYEQVLRRAYRKR